MLKEQRATAFIVYGLLLECPFADSFNKTASKYLLLTTNSMKKTIPPGFRFTHLFFALKARPKLPSKLIAFLWSYNTTKSRLVLWLVMAYNCYYFNKTML